MKTRLEIIRSELDADPSAIGYTGNAEKKADQMNLVDKTRNIASLSTDDIFEALDPTETASLTAAGIRSLMVVLSREQVDPFGVSVQFLVNAYGGQSTAISNLAALRRVASSRAGQLDLGAVTEADIRNALTLD